MNPPLFVDLTEHCDVTSDGRDLTFTAANRHVASCTFRHRFVKKQLRCPITDELMWAFCVEQRMD